MNYVKALLLFLCIGFLSFSQAQDIHYTMYDMAPIRVNAARTGFFEGTFRIGGIYRSQWRGLGPSGGVLGTKFSGYQTPHAYIDLPFRIPKKNAKGPVKRWAGIGATFFSDEAGINSTTNATLALAYHIGLNQRGNTRLSLGIQGGIVQNRIDPSDFRFEQGIRDALGQSVDYVPTSDNSLDRNSVSYADFSGGILFAHRGTRGFNLEAGLALNHFTRPTYGFFSDKSIKMPMALLSSLQVDVPLSQRLLLRPMVFYHNANNAQEINLQTLLGVHFNQMKDITLYLGGGYRIEDAAFARIGLDLKGLLIGFAYDLNMRPALTPSSSTFSYNRPMGFEVALSYVAKIYKYVTVKEVLFCPRF